MNILSVPNSVGIQKQSPTTELIKPENTGLKETFKPSLSVSAGRVSLTEKLDGSQLIDEKALRRDDDLGLLVNSAFKFPTLPTPDFLRA